jgi:hypothetical protein
MNCVIAYLDGPGRAKVAAACLREVTRGTTACSNILELPELPKVVSTPGGLVNLAVWASSGAVRLALELYALEGLLAFETRCKTVLDGISTLCESSADDVDQFFDSKLVGSIFSSADRKRIVTSAGNPVWAELRLTFADVLRDLCRLHCVTVRAAALAARAVPDQQATTHAHAPAASTAALAPASLITLLHDAYISNSAQ